MTRRELAYYLFFAAAALLGLTVVVLTIWALRGNGQLVLVGPVDNFPIQSTPYEFTYPDGVVVFLVNTGSGLVAFDGHTTADVSAPCRLAWLPDNPRFEDPCLGTKFRLDGTRCGGPASRDLDQYAIVIREGRVWIDISRLMRGRPSAGFSGDVIVDISCDEPP